MSLVWSEIDSPVGRLILVSDGTVLKILEFAAVPERVQASRTSLARRHPGVALETGAPPSAVAGPLAAYFAGELDALGRIAVAPEGTPFERRVWDELMAIPAGETRSYGELARRLGQPGAMRAVGGANGRNPIAIVIPCHRVIASDGTLGGYGGGLEIKRRLLALENAACVAGPVPAQAALPLSGAARRPHPAPV